MTIVGKQAVGATTRALASDTRLTTSVVMPAGRLPAVQAYLDGLGSGAGPQAAKAVVYDGSGNLLVTSAEVSVLSGAASAWVPFVFAGAAVIAAGTYSVGLIAGLVGNTIRVYGDPGGLSSVVADAYADGPSAGLGAGAQVSTDLSIYGDVFAPYAPPVNELEFYYARLPFPEAQKKFGETPPVVTSRRLVTCAWHGTRFDVERGSFCVVKTGGVLEGLVGERVRITTRFGAKRSVAAFVHNTGPLDDELSVPRRLFMELAAPALDRVSVVVEKLA